MNTLPTKYTYNGNKDIIDFLRCYEPDNKKEAIVFRKKLLKVINHYTPFYVSEHSDCYLFDEDE